MLLTNRFSSSVQAVKEISPQTAGSDHKPGCYNHVHGDMNIIRLLCSLLMSCYESNLK